MTEGQPIPAATVVVMRDRPAGPPELLMVERAAAMVFAGGALVFPGGRIDAGDHMLAVTFSGDAEDMAARLAAIRETLEEAGLAIGITPLPSADRIGPIRHMLHEEGVPLGEALGRHGLRAHPEQLVPFARWLPGHRTARVFDTRFYLARMDEAAPPPVVDGDENVRLFWATAQQVLADADAGRVTIIYPTRRNLERLAQFESYEAAVADARAHPVVPITPFAQDRGGVPHLCIPEGLGYPVTAEPRDKAMRG